MSTFAFPVRWYAQSAVHTLLADARLADAERLLSAHRLSALPVLDAAGSPVGVLSRTDLLRAGRMRSQNGHRERVLDVPDARVREHMHAGVEVVAEESPLHGAARRMVKQHIHRVYVRDHDRLLGVLATADLMRAVIDVGVKDEIGALVRHKLVTVDAKDPVSLAVDRMTASHITGVVVMSDAWPVGVFGQEEALAARDAAPSSPVEAWSNPGFVAVPRQLPAVRAAAQALALGTRRVIVLDGARTIGVATGMDFARLVADSGSGG